MNSRQAKMDEYTGMAGSTDDTHRGTGASVVVAVPLIVCCTKTIEMTVEIQWRREPLQ